MTPRELLPGVYEILRAASWDISDSIATLRDIDEGFTTYSKESTERGRRKQEANRIRRRKEQAKNDVSEKLEAAGRPDLVGPFNRFIDKYLASPNAGRLIEKFFDTER